MSIYIFFLRLLYFIIFFNNTIIFIDLRYPLGLQPTKEIITARNVQTDRKGKCWCAGRIRIRVAHVPVQRLNQSANIIPNTG